MNKQQVIKELEEIIEEVFGDPECAHQNAESSLLSYLDSNGMKDVADAYRRCRDEVGFWYA